MYLKYIRHAQPSGNYCRGTLYCVHFEPNEKGGYNEHLQLISDAYEIPFGDGFPLPLIYPTGVVRINSNLRLTLGDSHHRSSLHLINHSAREQLFEEVLAALREHQDCRMEVSEASKLYC